jgi:hypothetical protein
MTLDEFKKLYTDAQIAEKVFGYDRCIIVDNKHKMMYDVNRDVYFGGVISWHPNSFLYIPVSQDAPDDVIEYFYNVAMDFCNSYDKGC